MWGCIVWLSLEEHGDVGRLMQCFLCHFVECLYTVGDRCVVWSFTVRLRLEKRDGVERLMQCVIL